MEEFVRSCPQARGLLPATDPLSPCSQHAQKIKIKITSAQMSKHKCKKYIKKIRNKYSRLKMPQNSQIGTMQLPSYFYDQHY